MGMFDTVHFKCPNCGGEIESQSKAGECLLRDYTPLTAPPAVLGDLSGEYVNCPSCDRTYVVQVAMMAQLVPA